MTDKVWHELAFGLENMKLPQSVIRRRVSEMSSYFGIEDWFDRNVSELSGGQKQLLNLASVMVMQPEVLILDEPTAQLDPIAASEFISTVKKLNEELSLTVIIAEHRLEEIIPVSDKLLVLGDGGMLDFGSTRAVCERMRQNASLVNLMPASVRLYAGLECASPCPLGVREGRLFVESNFANGIRSLEPTPREESGTPVLEMSDVWLRYGRELPDVLRGTEITVFDNEFMCILGGNGSGKTTALGVCAGLLEPYCGIVKIFGKKIKTYKGQSLYRGCLAMLPQDVQTLFLRDTVREELEDAGSEVSSLPYDLSALMDKHPFDLSGGEQQLVALAKVLAAKPRLLLLDEPTKGLDANAKRGIAQVLADLKASGMTIVAVTHDAEFAAACADRCAMFFRGEITCVDEPRAFFSGNNFYTTAANRMTRGYYDGIVTVEDAVEICRLNGAKGAAP